MPLIVPRIDDRDYGRILQDALARIPVHTPEWTNFNDADPGVTLLQLFAFMTDSLLYRANLIPERNRLKFLELLGIPLRPPAAATGVAAIANERGPLETVTLPRELQLLAGPVGFVTRNALDVLPVEGRVFYRAALEAGSEEATAERMYAQLYGETGEDASSLDFYRTTPFEPPVNGARIGAVSLTADAVDQALWLALMVRAADGAPDDDLRARVRRAIAGKTVTLGFVPAWDQRERAMRPGGAPPRQLPHLSFDVSTGEMNGDAPVYRRLDAAADDDALENLTLVQLTLPEEGSFGAWDDLDPMEEGVGELPPALDDEKLTERVLCWIRIRLDDSGAEGEASRGWQARFSWLGINAVRVAQRVPVPALRVGTGTGEPDQSLTLPNTPVLPDSVVLTVAGEAWRRVDDLLSAPPEVPVGDPAQAAAAASTAGDPRVFHVDRESGVVRFGTGYAGMRPPPGAPIIAAYAYGGGRAGNVGVGAIRTAPRLPAGFRPHNPVPTWGGDDGESVREAERRIPLHLKHQDRAVSEEDFREIVPQTPGISLGRMEVLSSWHPSIGSPAPGVVTLLLVPDDPLRPEGPVPDRLFLQAVCRHLEPRRLVTTEVHLRGPEYVPLSVAVGFDAIAGSDVAAVREEVKAALRRFLSPLVGGHPVQASPAEPAAPRGWPLETAVEDRELWAQVARVPGVASVRGVRMWNAEGVELATLSLSGLQLPRLDNVSVRTGDAEDLASALTGGAGTGTDGTGTGGAAPKRRPVPVVPRSC